LESQIFHVFGVPEVLWSDNGKQFKSKIYNDLISKYSINPTYTAFHSPQANNSERVNRTLIAAIRAYIKDNNQRNWDMHLSEIAACLRNSFHCATKFSPYFSLFGQSMILHGSHYKLLKNLQDLEEGTVMLETSDKLKLLRSKVQENLNKAFQNNQKTYNLRTRNITFEPGETVFRRNFVQSSKIDFLNAKLCPKFIKSKVLHKIGNHYYELLDINSNKSVGTYHAKDILKSNHIS
jgi:hypothetical protein